MPSFTFSVLVNLATLPIHTIYLQTQPSNWGSDVLDFNLALWSRQGSKEEPSLGLMNPRVELISLGLWVPGSALDRRCHKLNLWLW